MNTITLTLNPRDRTTLATTIERLVNLLDSLDPDSDFEPSLGFIGHGIGYRAGEDRDDREPNGDELDYSDADCDTGGFIWGGGEEAPAGQVRL